MSRLALPARNKSGAVLLSDVLEQFFALSAARSPKTHKHYRRAVGWLGEVLGRPAKISDLSDDSIRALLNWCLTTRKQSAVTANQCHKCLCRLWRWLRDRGLISTGPTIPALREPVRTPRAWSVDELRRLVQAAARQSGTIGGMPASTWWLALLAIEWDTACRSGELLALRWEWLDWSRGWLVVPAEYRKGGSRDAAYGLMPDTLEMLRSISRPSGLILGWSYHIARYYQLWDGLLESAGLPRGRRFTTHCLRRSVASWIASTGGDATAALGHASRAVTLSSYIDPTIAARRAGEQLPFRLLDLRHDPSTQ